MEHQKWKNKIPIKQLKFCFENAPIQKEKSAKIENDFNSRPLEQFC